MRTPTLKVFRPARPNGAAVLVMPGGGYRRVVLDKEGDETARRLAEAGIVAAVLVYRLPEDGWAAGWQAPLQDAQRAVVFKAGDGAGAFEGVVQLQSGVPGHRCGKFAIHLIAASALWTGARACFDCKAHSVPCKVPAAGPKSYNYSHGRSHPRPSEVAWGAAPRAGRYSQPTQPS